MQGNKKIALYADVTGADLTYDNFIHGIANLEQTGEIFCAKIYNASERRHKEILREVAARGYDVAPPQRGKKAPKAFDNRITVDIMEDVLQNTNLDAVAVIAPPADLVYLFRRLRSYNIFIMTLDNGDEETSALVDEFLDIGRVDKLQPARPKQKKPAPGGAQAAPKSEPNSQEPDTQGETTDKTGLEAKAEAVQLSQSPADDESAELLEEIQKLLDEFKDN